jgi:hypothetical protein
MSRDPQLISPASEAESSSLHPSLWGSDGGSGVEEPHAATVVDEETGSSFTLPTLPTGSLEEFLTNALDNYGGHDPSYGFEAVPVAERGEVILPSIEEQPAVETVVDSPPDAAPGDEPAVRKPPPEGQSHVDALSIPPTQVRPQTLPAGETTVGQPQIRAARQRSVHVSPLNIPSGNSHSQYAGSAYDNQWYGSSPVPGSGYVTPSAAGFPAFNPNHYSPATYSHFTINCRGSSHGKPISASSAPAVSTASVPAVPAVLPAAAKPAAAALLTAVPLSPGQFSRKPAVPEFAHIFGGSTGKSKKPEHAYGSLQYTNTSEDLPYTVQPSHTG